jgi:flap endonuclease-1
VSPQQLPWDAIAGKVLAVDGYNAVYQFLATIRQADGQLFSDAEGRPTSHLMGVFYRTTALLCSGVKPVWVFDGKPPDLKAGTLRTRMEAKERAESEWKEALEKGDLDRARRKAAATSRLTRSMVEEVRQLLDALGVPSVQAPSEGEAQAAYMAAKHQVWAAASEDYDSLLFGAPKLVRGLAARQNRSTRSEAQIIDRDDLLARLGLSSDELILIGLVVGTDFNEGARGFGPKRALKLVQKHLGWDETLRAASLDPAEVNPVADLFRHPQVADVPLPTFRPFDERAVSAILVERHAFSQDRVLDALRRTVRRTAREPTEMSKGRQTALDTFGEPST